MQQQWNEALLLYSLKQLDTVTSFFSNGVRNYNTGIDGRMFMANFLHVLHVDLNVVPFNVFIQHVLDFKLILGI